MMLVERIREVILGLSIAACGCAEDPFDFGGPRSCELADQNAWAYTLMQDAYLWSDQMMELEPADYASPGEVVAALRVSPDRWSRVSDKARTNALFEEGKTVGFGFTTRRDLLGRLVIAYVTPGSPADAAGMARGDVLEQIGGFTIEQIDTDELWGDVYGADEPGVPVALALFGDDNVRRELTVVKDWVTIETVPITRIHRINDRPVGYLLFATFVDTAPPALDDAFEEFEKAGVRDVIIDLRYNGGGRIAVARHLAELLAGDVANGDVGYSVQYGPGLVDQNVSRGLSRISHRIRDPRRVVFITSHTSISASELVINIVRPYVDTRVVGDVTGGKPVGSHQWSFCDKIAQPITFELVNAEGVGDYFDGIAPDCVAADDLAHALGDANEGALAQALRMADADVCEPRAPSSTDASGPGKLGPVREIDVRADGIDELLGFF